MGRDQVVLGSDPATNKLYSREPVISDNLFDVSELKNLMEGE